MNKDEKEYIHEIDMIHEMMAFAWKMDREVEVVWTYGIAKATGKSTYVACNCAIAEWDF